MQREVFQTPLDLRTLKDEANRELAQPTAHNPVSKRSVRPFQRITVMQQEKLKFDKNLRDRLSKEKRIEQQKSDKREHDINRAMKQKASAPAGQKHDRGRKSMSSAFFKVVRPLSTAFYYEKSHETPRIRRTASELDFTPANKTTLVINVADARVAPFINDQRSFVFQLDTEDGGHYLLQAMSANDMSAWTKAIIKIARSTAQKRLTYLGSPNHSPLFDIQEEPSTTSSRHLNSGEKM